MNVTYLNKIKPHISIESVTKFISFLGTLYVLNSLASAFVDTYADRIEFSNYLNFLVKVFQNTVFGFLLINIFCKFKYRYLGYILPVAYLEQADSIFANKFHPFLVQSGFYNHFSDNPWLISPEYPRVIIFFALIFISVGLLFTKWRTFQRIFVVLGSLGVFFTALLFHTVIIYEITSFKKQDATVMENIIKTGKNPDDINSMCAVNGYICFAYLARNEEQLFTDSSIPQAIRKELPYLQPYFYQEPYYFWYGISHEPHATNRLLGQTPFSIGRTKDISVIIKNDGTYREFFIVNQYVFVWLSLASHMVWFLGSLFLIYFHQKRIRNRNKQKLNID